MSIARTFWTIRFTAPPDKADRFARVFEDDALAVTVMSPPRTVHASVEALYDHEPDLAAASARVTILATMNGWATPQLRVTEVPPLDWLKKVAEDFPPLRIARWTVHGAQHRAAVPDRRYALQIDATSAFGTGEHPTTRGCLIALDRLLKRTSPRRMLDVGCGSGILAMAFTKSRPGQAIAVDLDADSVRIAVNNAQGNGLRQRLNAFLGSGYRDRRVRSSAPYDLIMANIFAVPLSHMAKDLKRHLKPGGEAILSGILNHQANRVIAAHRMQGIHLTRRITIGEWSVLMLKRRKKPVLKSTKWT